MSYKAISHSRSAGVHITSPKTLRANTVLPAPIKVIFSIRCILHSEALERGGRGANLRFAPAERGYLWRFGTNSRVKNQLFKLIFHTILLEKINVPLV